MYPECTTLQPSQLKRTIYKPPFKFANGLSKEQLKQSQKNETALLICLLGKSLWDLK